MSTLNTTSATPIKTVPMNLRIFSSVPVGYRLVQRENGDGRIEYLLQGLFTWTQGKDFGREWRDLETQNWLFADDNVPF